jgi:hypothetical protein
MNQEVRDLAGNLLFEGRSLDRMMFTRELNPGQLEIIREIVTGGTSADLDTALYGDVMANYTVVKNLDGSFSVTHSTVTVGTISALTGKTLQSYSIAGRSFAFRTPAEAKQAADGAKHEMLNLLGRAESGAALIDHSGGRW